MRLPDFHIPHDEKIDWMIETQGWAIEVVAAQPAAEPPTGGHVSTVGFPEAFGFPEVVVFGLTPVAARGLVDLVAELLAGGTQIPVGVELTGLLDGELRCLFAPIDPAVAAGLLGSARRWRGGRPFEAVQLMWPDRNGFLPTEPGFDRRLVLAQPVVASVS